jgi:hypothetical protein
MSTTVAVPVTPAQPKRAAEVTDTAESPATASKKPKIDAAPAFDPTFGASKEKAERIQEEDKASDDKAAREDEDADGEDGEGDSAGAVLDELIEMFTQKNGRAPTADEIGMWVQQIRELNEAGPQPGVEDDEDDEDDESEEDESEEDEEDESEEDA